MDASLSRRGDEDLVRLAQSRPDSDLGREAAACVLQRHARKIYVWCCRYATSDEEARDLAQDVIVQAYTRLGSFGHRSRFTSWLFALARNCCLSHVQRSRPTFAEGVDPDTLPSSARDPEQLLLEQLGETAMLSLIATTLSREEQDAIWLRCFDRLPIESITEILGLQNASGARALMQRARRKLKAALEAARDENRETDHG